MRKLLIVSILVIALMPATYAEATTYTQSKFILPNREVNLLITDVKGVDYVSADSLLSSKVDIKRIVAVEGTEGSLRVVGYPAGSNGISNLYFNENYLENLFNMALIDLNDNKELIYLSPSVKTKVELLKLKERFKKSINNTTKLELPKEGVIFKEVSILWGNTTITESSEVPVKLKLNNSIIEDKILIKFEPGKVVNDRDYEWFVSQRYTGNQSSLNCAFANIAMINRWKDESYNKSVQKLRDESKTTGAVYLDYIVKGTSSEFIGVDSFEDVKKEIDSGNILSVAVDTSIFYSETRDKVYHSVVVYGYNVKKDGISLYVMDPWEGKLTVDSNVFMKSIKDTSNYIIKVKEIMINDKI